MAEKGLKVALFDKGALASEASWASAGMIGPAAAPGIPWYQEATTLSKQLYDELDARLYNITGRKIGYGGNGMLTIATTEAESRALRRQVDHDQTCGIATELLTGRDARCQEPALPEDTLTAAWRKDNRYLDARTYTQIIAAAACRLGALLFPGQPVVGLVRKNTTIVGVETPEGPYFAKSVINTAGAWAGQIDPILTHPVKPLHGQIMALSPPACGLRHNLMKAGAWGYATPRDDGRVLIGATEDEWGFEKKITPDGLSLLGSITRNLLPCLKDCEILDVWSGLRPASPDGLPTLGPDPRVGGGYLWAAGHTPSGIMQAPATAAVLTDLVMETHPRINIDQVLVDRFL
jgi:glycine oxidase